ncbi:hypothetical protein DERP_014315 [Dermatophagoides pteronyssinus]|uniref:Uncharacterized protein n=1 Tax=Dermatophagoides pteronyssinus TaxID=6956 RepID=A0ABQ8JWQ7_DERPT|nr:hypothetical protein DERP_014315 [Dermatophagoides pteronyssinus]
MLNHRMSDYQQNKNQRIDGLILNCLYNVDVQKNRKSLAESRVSGISTRLLFSSNSPSNGTSCWSFA